jgi:hypothetical protein
MAQLLYHPILNELAERYSGALSPYSTDWPRTIKEVLTLSEKDQLN